MIRISRSRARIHKRMLLLGMPSWGVRFPFHALALVSGIVRRAGWICRAADLNIKLYRSVTPKEQSYWEDDNCGLWQQRRLMRRFHAKYRRVVQTELRRLVAEGPYDFVAFSVNSFNRYFTQQAVRFIRRHSRLPILFGGVDCFPREHGRRFFDGADPPDAICQGEAEVALPEFLRAVEQSDGDWRVPVRGFAYRLGGRWRWPGRRARVVDHGEPELPELEEFDVVPDWEQFDHGQYTQPGAFQTFASRGCINRCKFCSESPNFKRFRFRKAERVVAEIEQVMRVTGRYDPHPFVHFADSLLTANPEQLSRFCDLLLQSGLRITWAGQAYFRDELDAELLGRMHAAGCRGLFWGFESASQQVVDLMGKNYRQAVARRILADCRRIGIHSVLPVIVGFPGERVCDFLETLRFVLQSPWAGQFLGPNVCLVRPNSALHTHYARFGLANNDYYVWSTTDGRNTFAVRWFRVFMMRNVRLNASLRPADAVMLDHRDFQRLDFNDPALAAEIAANLYQLAAANGRAEQAAGFLAHYDGRPLGAGGLQMPPDVDYWHPEGVPAGVPMGNWFCRDKNSPPQRRRIVDLIFAELRRMRELGGETPEPVATERSAADLSRV